MPAVGAFCLCLDPRRPRPFPDLLAVAPPLHSHTRCLATRVSPRLQTVSLEQVGTVSYFTDDTSLMAGSVKQDKHFRFVQLNESINMRRCMPEPEYTWLRGCGPAPQATHSQKVVQVQLQLPPTAPDVNTCSELQVLVSWAEALASLLLGD